jgi:hypothetical protein
LISGTVGTTAAASGAPEADAASGAPESEAASGAPGAGAACGAPGTEAASCVPCGRVDAAGAAEAGGCSGGARGAGDKSVGGCSGGGSLISGGAWAMPNLLESFIFLDAYCALRMAAAADR